MRLEARLRRLEKAGRVTEAATLSRRNSLAIRAFLMKPPGGKVAALQAIGPSPLRDSLLSCALKRETSDRPAT